MSGEFAVQVDIEGDVEEVVGGFTWTCMLLVEGFGENSIKVSAIEPLETREFAERALRRAARTILFQMRSLYQEQGFDVDLRHVADVGGISITDAEELAQ